MRLFGIRLLILSLLLLASGAVRAIPTPLPLTVQDGEEPIDLGYHAHYLLESRGQGGTLPQEALAQFTPLEQRSPNFGVSQGQVWFWSRLENTSDTPLRRILTLAFSSAHCDVYLLPVGELPQADSASLPTWRSGDWQLLYRLELPPHAQRDLFTRCHSNIFLGFRLHLDSEQGYWRQEITESWIQAGYYGALIILGLYNLFLFLSLRERVYLYYLLSMAAFGGIQTGVDGIALSHLLDDKEGILWYVAALSALASFALTLFTRELLQTRRAMPRWDKALQVLMWFGLLTAPVLPFMPTALVMVSSFLSGWVMPLMLFTTGILALSIGQYAARYYLAAWSIYLLSYIAFSSAYFGIELFDLNLVDYSYFNKFASLVEVSLLALALADRITRLRHERERARNELVTTLRRHADELQRKVAERTADLQAANDAKDKFFSIISHDLRGPVGSLSVLFNEIIQQGADLSDELLHGVRESTRNTHRLLEDLLVWARGQRGEIEVNPQHLAVAEVLRDSMQLVATQVAQRRLHLTCNCDGQLYAYADSAMVTTVVRNFLGNAVKFTPPGGSIELACRVYDDTQIEVSVSDSGEGLSNEVREGLFRLGERGSSSVQQGGSGLGLILCRDFVMRLGGQIGVESTPGQGSRFWFTLPIGMAPEGRRIEGLPRLAGLHVLVVEDDRLHLESTAQVLRGLGLDYDHAGDGGQALATLAQRQYDLILMDITLPLMDGIEVTRRIQQGGGEQPLIFSLSSWSEEELRQFPEVQFDGFLSKPLQRERLLAQLLPLLDARLD